MHKHLVRFLLVLPLAAYERPAEGRSSYDEQTDRHLIAIQIKSYSNFKG